MFNLTNLDQFSMQIILLYICKFFLFFICAGSHFIRNGILTHVSIEDLASDACEFDNMSNDQKHPAEPSISLLFIVLTLSPCQFLVVVNLNRLDQEKKMLNKIKYLPRGGPMLSLKQIKSPKRGQA